MASGQNFVNTGARKKVINWKDKENFCIYDDDETNKMYKHNQANKQTSSLNIIPNRQPLEDVTYLVEMGKKAYDNKYYERQPSCLYKRKFQSNQAQLKTQAESSRGLYNQLCLSHRAPLKSCQNDPQFTAAGPSFYKTVAKDSLPLSRSRLEVNKNNMFLNMSSRFKNVTKRQNYDHVFTDDSLVERQAKIIEGKDFFDDAEMYFDEDKTLSNSGQSSENETFCEEMNSMVLNVPNTEGYKTTPINTHDLLFFQDIKRNRREYIKNFVRVQREKIKLAIGLPVNYTTVEERSIKSGNIGSKVQQALVSNDITSSFNINIPSPLLYVEQKETRKKYPRIHLKELGTVDLDAEENFVDTRTLYSTRYLLSIVKHLLHIETKYQLSNNFLKGTHITDLNRSIVINWLLKIQTYMRTEHVLIYTAVRIMDQAIDVLDIPLNMLQLVGLASYWMSLKYHAVQQEEITWMVSLTGGAYQAEELAKVERSIFKANNFDVHAVDSSIYIHYYIMNLKLSNADVIAECAHYLLDCSLLNSRFNRSLPSFMAAAAIYTSLHIMNQYSDNLWMQLCLHAGYYTPDQLKSAMRNLIYVLKQVNDPSFPCREPYYKYCSSRYCGVAHIVLDAILMKTLL